MPFMLELFTHSGCISREGGRQQIESALTDFPEISFNEIDIIKDRQKAEAVGVKMSPTLVLDNKVLCVGIPPSRDLEKLLRAAMEGTDRVS